MTTSTALTQVPPHERVSTKEGFLDADQAIFLRLVDKVDEINRSTRTGESVLKLYDAKREEEYIATRGVIARDTDVLDKATLETAESAGLEETLLAANQEGHEDWLAFLTGETDAPSAQSAETARTVVDSSRIRLMPHAEFFERGYRTLQQALEDPSYLPLQKTNEQFILNPPSDLKRRLGAPSSASGAAGDVVFGATAIPEESWAEDGHLYRTEDPDRVDEAIRAALAQKGQWSGALLLTEQHPVLQWLAERLMMLMKRDESPLIASPHLDDGERGTPYRWHLPDA